MDALLDPSAFEFGDDGEQAGGHPAGGGADTAARFGAESTPSCLALAEAQGGTPTPYLAGWLDG
jgi:hypothetical protein